MCLYNWLHPTIAQKSKSTFSSILIHMGTWDIARKAISYGNSFSLQEFRKLFHFFKNISQIPRQIKSKKCGIKISLKAQVSTKLDAILFQSLARVYFPSHLHSTNHCLCIFCPSISCSYPDLLKIKKKFWSRLWHLKWCHSSQEKSIIQQRRSVQLSNTSAACLALVFFNFKYIIQVEFMGSRVYG